MTDVS